MNPETPWEHLPNAKHIDTILADVTARPGVWHGMWGVDWAVARDAAHEATWAAGREELLGEVWGITRAVTPDTAKNAVRDAIRALIAWDDSARMLDMAPEALRTLIAIAEGDVKHQAMLLLPAVIALQGART